MMTCLHHLGLLCLLALATRAVLFICGEDTENHTTNATQPEQTNKTFKYYRGCTLDSDQLVMGALPGMGWDNLRGTYMGRVLALNYSQCLLTEDRRYLIPEGMTVIAIKTSQLDYAHSEVNHFTEYEPSTSKDRGIGIETYITAVFSEQSETARVEQIHTGRTLLQSNFRYNKYEVVAQAGIPLTTEFIQRVTDLAEELMSAYDSMENAPYADYLAECIVRDFGTHVAMSLEVGALLTKLGLGETAVQSTVDSEEHSKRRHLAFNSTQLNQYVPDSPIIHINFGKSLSKVNGREDIKNRTLDTNKIYTYGGMPYGPNFTVEGWQENLNNDLVATNVHTEHLYSLITRDSFPHLPPPMVYEARDRLQKAILRYYQVNTNTGCLELHNAEFASTAVMNDVTMCSRSKEEFYFGGMYQTCSDPNVCKSLVEMNPLTKGLKCTSSGRPVELTRPTEFCIEACAPMRIKKAKWFWFIKISRSHHAIVCREVCAMVETYWCHAATSQEESDADPQPHYFGGFYSKEEFVPNIVTQSYECPDGHMEFTFGINMKVCLTTDPEKKVLSFGGFFSCNVPNPYAGNVYGCPKGFIAQIGFLHKNCEVSFCSKAVELKTPYGMPTVKLPPYTTINSMAMERRYEERSIDFGENLVWVNQNGEWTIEKLNESANMAREMDGLFL